MHSALKHEGKALYKYAREGLEIERKARHVTIQDITVISLDASDAVINVRCSKGTYIRTLAEDIGSTLGCDGHLTGLRRTETAGYNIQDAMTIEQLEAMTTEMRDQLLLPVDSAIDILPKVHISTEAAYFFRQGQAIWEQGQIPDGSLRIYEEGGAFIGLGMRLEDGKIGPKRLVNL
jgi:tRNA pseudouridine55 synthase